MLRRWIIAVMFAPFVGQLWGAELSAPVTSGTPTSQYYRVYPSGLSIYKVEAMRALVTPEIRAEAAHYSRDTRVQELVCLARALDSLAYDGFRLVRLRGALVTGGSIDEAAICRTTLYFNVTASEAKAWLLASRLMQLSKFKDDGVALMAVENELSDTAADLWSRLRTYFGENGAAYFLPHFSYLNGRWSFTLPASETLIKATPLCEKSSPKPDKKHHRFLGLF